MAQYLQNVDFMLFLPTVQSTDDNSKESLQHDSIYEDSTDSKSEIKTLSQEDVKIMFKNPRDRTFIGKQRVRTQVDAAVGDPGSWHFPSDRESSLIGTNVPYGNRSKRTSKIWNDMKKIKGEIRGKLTEL